VIFMGSSRTKATARLNIYVHDAVLRRRVKAEAAEAGLSVSEYCVRAITVQIARARGQRAVEEARTPSGTAVQRARKFQTDTFGNRVFTVSSADLIREAREQHSP
jgi:hypothetical protein